MEAAVDLLRQGDAEVSQFSLFVADMIGPEIGDDQVGRRRDQQPLQEVLEEVQVRDGVVRNASFTDYLIPTILDMPPMQIEVLEYGDPNAPYGLRGVGEPPTISSGPAVAAAIRAATGLPLGRVPIRPEYLTGT